MANGSEAPKMKRRHVSMLMDEDIMRWLKQRAIANRTGWSQEARAVLLEAMQRELEAGPVKGG